MINKSLNQIESTCAVYLRRSQDREDRQQLSIDKQDSAVRNILKENKLKSFYYPTEERSAKQPGRPVFKSMIQDIKDGKARYIAVWALSRLSRNAYDAGQIIQLMDDNHLLAIHTPIRTYRNNPDDKAFLAIELTFAKKNNDDLSKQVSESFKQKTARGEYPGPAPVGYLNALIGPGRRNIIPDQEKAIKVIELFSMAGTGSYSLDELWRHSTKIGLHSRKNNLMSKQSISEMLQRRLYTGAFKYGSEEWSKGSFEPLITVEVFDRVQYEMGWRRGVKRPSTTSGRSYIYKGVLMCGECGMNITACTKQKKLAKGSTVEYVYYSCTRKHKKIKCKNPQVTDTLLHREVSKVASEYEISEEDGIKCINWLNQLYDDYVASKNQYKPMWMNDQRKAQKAMDTLDQKLEDGTISDSRYKERIKLHESMVVRTTELLGNHTDDAKQWLELATDTFRSAVNIGEVFNQADDNEKEKIMTQLGSNWNLNMKKVELTLRRPFDLLHFSSRNLDWRTLTLDVWNYYCVLSKKLSASQYSSNSLRKQ